MTKREIIELMKVKGWSKAGLAAALDLSENTVHKWLNGDRIPGGPAGILMRMWLDEARSVSLNGKEPLAL